MPDDLKRRIDEALAAGLTNLAQELVELRENQYAEKCNPMLCVTCNWPLEPCQKERDEATLQ